MKSVVRFAVLAGLTAMIATTASPVFASTARKPSVPPSSPPATAIAATTTVGITINIDNQSGIAAEGTDVTYRLTVRNNSDIGHPQALITHMLPPALTFGSAEPAPTSTNESKLEGVRTTELSWIRNLPAHGEATIDVRTAVGRPSEGHTSVSTTACIQPDGVSRPLICDTDSDRFDPAGDLLAWAWWLLGTALLLGSAIFLLRSKGLWARIRTHRAPNSPPALAHKPRQAQNQQPTRIREAHPADQP